MIQPTGNIIQMSSPIFSLPSIREASDLILRLGASGELPHFQVDLSKMDLLATEMANSFVLDKTPNHTQWRNFDPDGAGRLEKFKTTLSTQLSDSFDCAKSRFDLLLLNEALETGGNGTWTFQDQETGRQLSRTEGLAVATLRAFELGLFSAHSDNPYRVDSSRLLELTEGELASAFQITPENPIRGGVQGRVDRLRTLGELLERNSSFSGADGTRPANFLEQFRDFDSIELPSIFNRLAFDLVKIWPGNRIGGSDIGDVWRHSVLEENAELRGLVPIHRITQWLHYAIVELLNDSGIKANGTELLTGLAGYRNTGLLVDREVIIPKDPTFFSADHRLGDEAIVELRSLTVGLLDRSLGIIHDLRGLDQHTFPMSKLNGLAWRLGRKVALELRTDGSPPFKVSDEGIPF